MVLRHEERMMFILFVPFVLLNLLDAVTTGYALSIGCYELNDLYFLPNFGMFKLFIPFLVLFVYLGICHVSSYRIIHKFCLFSFLCLVFFSFGVVINNLFWILNV